MSCLLQFWCKMRKLEEGCTLNKSIMENNQIDSCARRNRRKKDSFKITKYKKISFSFHFILF